MYVKQILSSVIIAAGITGSAVYAATNELDNYNVEIIHHGAENATNEDASMVIGTTTVKQDSQKDNGNTETAGKPAKGTASVSSQADDASGTGANAGSQTEDEWGDASGTSVTAEQTSQPDSTVIGKGVTYSDGSRTLDGAGCSKPEPIPDVVVDTPTIPTIDLTETASTYTVEKGDTVGKILSKVKPEGFPVTNNQLVAAIMRANPKSFNNGNLLTGKTLDIPTAKRIALENDETGKEIMSRISSGKMAGFKLPALVLPWEEEEARITKQKSDKALRDAKVQQMQKDYDDCVTAVKNKKLEEEQKRLKEIEDKKKAEELRKQQEYEMANTEADIASDDLMIKDPEEEAQEKAQAKAEDKATVNEQGKRVIVLKQNQDNGNGSGSDSSVLSRNGRIEGANVIFNGSTVYALDANGHKVFNTTMASAPNTDSKEIDKIKEELKNAEQVNRELIDQKNEQLEKIASLEKQLDGLSSKIDSIVEMQNYQMHAVAESNLAEAQDQYQKLRDSQFAGHWILWVLSAISLIYLYAGIIVPKLKKNKKVRDAAEDNQLLSFILKNKLVDATAGFKKKCRNVLKELVEASEQDEQTQADLEAAEEKKKDQQLAEDEKKSSLLGKNTSKDKEHIGGAADVSSSTRSETPKPEHVEPASDYRPNSMVIERESEPVIPIGVTEEEQIEVTPSGHVDMEITATSENPEPKSVD